MPPRKTEDMLSHLDAAEAAQVLGVLLDRHPKLRQEASDIARSVIEDVSVEDVAGDMADLVTGPYLDDLNSRAGRQPWGYVEPGEAAWEILEEAMDATRADMGRRYRAGMKGAAEKICQGSIIGLHVAEQESGEGLHQYAPEFPAEAAALTMSHLLELYPRSQRAAAGKRIVAAVEDDVDDDWVKMLRRQVTAAGSTRKRRRT